MHILVLCSTYFDRTDHRHYAHEFRTRPATQRWVEERLMPTLSGGLVDPTLETTVLPPTNCSPLPALAVQRGIKCAYCIYICHNEGVMKQHYNVQHAAVRRHRGGNKANATGLLRERLDREHYGDQLPWISISFQRFFPPNQVQDAGFAFQAQMPLSEYTSVGLYDVEKLPQLQGPIDTLDRGSLMANSVFKELVLVN